MLHWYSVKDSRKLASVPSFTHPLVWGCSSLSLECWKTQVVAGKESRRAVRNYLYTSSLWMPFPLASFPPTDTPKDVSTSTRFSLRLLSSRERKRREEGEKVVRIKIYPGPLSSGEISFLVTLLRRREENFMTHSRTGTTQLFSLNTTTTTTTTPQNSLLLPFPEKCPHINPIVGKGLTIPG